MFPKTSLPVSYPQIKFLVIDALQKSSFLSSTTKPNLSWLLRKLELSRINVLFQYLCMHFKAFAYMLFFVSHEILVSALTEICSKFYQPMFRRMQKIGLKSSSLQERPPEMNLKSSHIGTGGRIPSTLRCSVHCWAWVWGCSQE